MNHASLAISLAALCTFTLTSVAPASTPVLKSPFAIVAPKADKDLSLTCEEAPPPAEVALDVTSVYDENDPSKSEIVDEQFDDYTADMQPLRDYVGEVTRFASNYVASKGAKPEHALCALVWLDSWARGGAMAKLGTRQAILSSTRIVAGMAMAYVTVRPVADAAGFDASALDKWFEGRADLFKVTYEESGDRNSNKSNHRYWGGFAVAAIGVAIGRRDLLDWGVESFRIGACQVDAEGALPLELMRKKRARAYHLVAIAPLVMTAELAAANGVDAYDLCDGAIHRVVKFTLNSIEHPELIESLTGAKMEKIPVRDGHPRGDQFAWVDPYFKRFGGSEDQYDFTLERPLFSSGLGGRISTYSDAVAN